MHIKKELIRAGIWWGLLLIFFLATNPVNLPVYILFVPFVMLGFAVYELVGLLIALYSHGRTRITDASAKKQKAAAISVAILTVIITGLESLGELAVRDIVVVVLLAIGAYFYFVRSYVQE